MILDKINDANDVKKLSYEEMKTLAGEIREGILKRVNEVGGHLGPDLGIVEATIALHYIFNSPKDRFVFDVSHQCYPHKMLTGRKDGFFAPKEHYEISGYFNPDESAHDSFIIGHTSTSISLATGLAKARDLKNEEYNVIALIGDGSLSGGEAFEGLNNASELNSNFIVVVNDNEMSIAENHGGLYGNLEELRKTKGETQNNYFKIFGFDYIYVEEGNDIKELIEAFSRVKDSKKPVVVHIHTLKGKGYKPAETLKEAHHWQMPEFMNPKSNAGASVETLESATKDYILKKKEQNPEIAVIVAGTPGVFQFNEDYRKKLGKNYTDVGIAEEHAIAYASGLAKNGAKPIACFSSSFIQRTYDQLSQDLALNSSPATILVWWAGISAMDMTHLCVFDIPLISNIPNIIYLAPTSREEYLKMLDWSVEQNSHPIAIRVPRAPLPITGIKDNTDYSILNKFKVEETGKEVALIGVGNFFELGRKVKNELKKQGVEATLINPKFLTGLDFELLDELSKSHKIVVTLEDGVLDGGFGEKIARFYGKYDIKVLNYGADKVFTDRIPVDEIYKRNRLVPELIAEDIQKALHSRVLA